MKCSLGISNFLEEISSLSHSIVFLYIFALITEESFLISPCYSLELCIQMHISFLFLLLLFFSQLFVRPPQTTILPFCISSSWGCFWLLLLLLLSRFSRVRLCATPLTAAHQGPLSLGFSRQNTGVGCHFLLQCMKVKSESEVTQSCPTLRDPMDCSLPGSSVRGIFQARILEWGAIAFSDEHTAIT